MDIQVASNFERYLYLRMGRDSARLRAFMDEFARTGEAKLESRGEVDPFIVAGSANTADTLVTIRETYQRHGYVVDPHTAVGITVGRRLAQSRPLVCLATAHPAKFPESVDKAIGRSVARHPRLDGLSLLKTRKHELPADEDVIKAFIERHAI